MIEFQFFWPFALVFGLCIGSFLNVCIYRSPIGLSIAKGTSICPHCSSRLYAADLVPVFSFLFLRGKCRYCKGKISPMYPVVELICGGLFVLAFYFFGINLQTLIVWIAISALIIGSVIDIRSMEIPDGVSLVLAIAGVLSFFVPGLVWWEHLLGIAAGAIPLLLIVIISKEKAMGMGDVQFMAAAGLLLGFKLALFALFAGVVFGALVSVLLLACKKKTRSDQIPFVPMLSFGILFSLFYGNAVIAWYVSILVS